MSRREEIIAAVRDGKLKKSKAAVLLGISRQRVGQIVKEVKPMTDAAAPAPAPADTAPPAAAAAGPSGWGSAPKDLGEAYKPIGETPSPAALPPKPPPLKVDAVPMTDDDVEDAKAGRSLINSFLDYGRKFVARVMYPDAKEGDPRLAELEKENDFLAVSLKRNQDKTAPLGWLTRGWKGLLIGFTIEVLRVAIAPGPKKQGEQAAPASKAEATVHDFPSREKSEEAPKPRRSLEEKIAAMNLGQEG